MFVFLLKSCFLLFNWICFYLKPRKKAFISWKGKESKEIFRRREKAHVSPSFQQSGLFSSFLLLKQSKYIQTHINQSRRIKANDTTERKTRPTKEYISTRKQKACVCLSSLTIILCGSQKEELRVLIDHALTTIVKENDKENEAGDRELLLLMLICKKKKKKRLDRVWADDQGCKDVQTLVYLYTCLQKYQHCSRRQEQNTSIKIKTKKIVFFATFNFISI